jgi:hypothetical protein
MKGFVGQPGSLYGCTPSNKIVRVSKNSVEEYYNNTAFLEPASYETCQAMFT